MHKKKKVVAAAGNDGEKGAFYISSPGSSPKTVAVGSVDNAIKLERNILTENGAEYGNVDIKNEYFKSKKKVS
jgi:hypothetical protein